MADLAIPKPGVRVRCEAAMAAIRAIGHCEKCGVGCQPHVHHVKSRGAGGHDEAGNLIALCPGCHDRAHRALIGRDELREIIGRRDG